MQGKKRTIFLNPPITERKKKSAAREQERARATGSGSDSSRLSPAYLRPSIFFFLLLFPPFSRLDDFFLPDPVPSAFAEQFSPLPPIFSLRLPVCFFLECTISWRGIAFFSIFSTNRSRSKAKELFQKKGKNRGWRGGVGKASLYEKRKTNTRTVYYYRCFVAKRVQMNSSWGRGLGWQSKCFIPNLFHKTTYPNAIKRGVGRGKKTGAPE